MQTGINGPAGSDTSVRPGPTTMHCNLSYHRLGSTLCLLIAALICGCDQARDAAESQSRPGHSAPSERSPQFLLAGQWDGSSLPGHLPTAESFWTSEVGAQARYLPAFGGPVQAHVWIYKVVHTENNDPAMQVEVFHAEERTLRSLDCSTGKSGWVDLGSFQFSGAAHEAVVITKVTPGVATRAAAAKFDVLGETGEVIASWVLSEVSAGPMARPTTKPFDPAGVRAGPPEHSQWQLSFEDAFEGDAIDTKVWSVEAGVPGHILSSRWPENVLVRDGTLRLLTRKEQRGGKEWTTGNIWTRSYQQQYGYFEVRMKIGRASGLNNAFWLMTQRKPTDPMHFEIDITEAKYPYKNHVALHNWAGKHSATGKQWRAPYDLSEDFHLYALEWDERQLIWYFDGQEIHRLPQDFCHLPSPLRLSSAVGTFAGQISDALDGTQMEVDYVRAWTRKAPAAAPTNGPMD